MNYQEVHARFSPILQDLLPADTYPHTTPLLAHYTTMTVLEGMARNNEVWLANPLFMNDVDEVRFGIENGMHVVRDSKRLAESLGTDERRNVFFKALEEIYLAMAEQHVLDYYVLCLSEHAPDDDDGVLSMWRAYGGNGAGVAVVFDTAQLGVEAVSYLVLGKVTYGTKDDLLQSIHLAVTRFVDRLTAPGVPTESLHLAAWMLFESLKFLALFSKHDGFKEEKEWRLVYLSERDSDKQLGKMLGYNVGPRGVEPKLKFKVAPMEGLTVPDMSLARVVDRLILGPTVATTIARAAVAQMLDRLDQPVLAKKLKASTIPFRSQF